MFVCVLCVYKVEGSDPDFHGIAWLYLKFASNNDEKDNKIGSQVVRTFWRLSSDPQTGMLQHDIAHILEAAEEIDQSVNKQQTIKHHSVSVIWMLPLYDTDGYMYIFFFSF